MTQVGARLFEDYKWRMNPLGWSKFCVPMHQSCLVSYWKDHILVKYKSGWQRLDIFASMAVGFEEGRWDNGRQFERPTDAILILKFKRENAVESMKDWFERCIISNPHNGDLFLKHKFKRGRPVVRPILDIMASEPCY